MAFRHQTRVMFQDADAAGIAFFARYFVWCHEAYEELMRAGGLPMSELVSGDVILPLANATADFKSPSALDDVLTVVVKVAELKEKAFVLEHEVLGPKGQLCAHVKTVHVAFSRQARKSVALPEKVLGILRAHQA
jgi:1,4-dihydroxy-2-naphthoyl-CoA hydrolase